MGGLHFEADGSGSLLELFRAGAGPLFAVRVQGIRSSVLRLVRLDGRMKDVRSEFDLEVEGIVRLSYFIDGAEDFLLPDETEGAVL